MPTKISSILGDITHLDTDVVVNAANQTLLGGGGVDGAIHREAGPELLRECKGLYGCKTGEAKITKGYNLTAKYIIHTVGPIYGKATSSDKLLADCYKNCLELAKVHKLSSIAFPCISTGAYGYPKIEAAIIALKTVKEFIKNNPNAFSEIVFACYQDEDFKIYNDLNTNKEI